MCFSCLLFPHARLIFIFHHFGWHTPWIQFVFSFWFCNNSSYQYLIFCFFNCPWYPQYSSWAPQSSIARTKLMLSDRIYAIFLVKWGSWCIKKSSIFKIFFAYLLKTWNSQGIGSTKKKKKRLENEQCYVK